MYSSTANSGTGRWMVMLANSSGGYNSPIDTGITNTVHRPHSIDYDADALDDPLVPLSGSTWWARMRGRIPVTS